MHNDYYSAMTRAGNVLIVLALALCCGALAACASKAEAPGLSTVAETVVTTTELVVDSTSLPTTVAPTTTIDPAVELAAEVEADLLEAFRLANEALQDPFNADKESAALERRTGFALGALQQNLADYRRGNLAIRPNPSVEASMTVEVPASLVQEGADLAQVQTCEIDPWIVVEVGAGPNGSDAVVEPNLYAYRSTAFLRSVDGIWRVEGGTEITSWDGLVECPPG